MTDIEKIEKVTNLMQMLSILPPLPGIYGVLTGQAGFTVSLADAFSKKHKNALKSGDIIDIFGGITTSVAGIATMAERGISGTFTATGSYTKSALIARGATILGVIFIGYTYLENNNWDVKKALNNANDDLQNGFDELQESVWDAIDYYNAVNYDDFKKDFEYSVNKMLEFFKSNDKHSQNQAFKNDQFTNLQNIASNETASNSQNSQTSRHSEPLIRHSERSEESQKNLQISQTSHSQQTPQLQNTRHSELSQESEESRKNLQNVNSQTSQNTPKWELTFNEKYVIKDFAHKLYGVKMPEIKQRIGADAATQCKISLFLGDICDYKRQIVQNFGEKTWQETFENFQKTNDLKVFKNAVKSPLSQQNANLQISNENANLKNPNLQNSAGNVNSENNITNPQENGNDFKM